MVVFNGFSGEHHILLRITMYSIKFPDGHVSSFDHRIFQLITELRSQLQAASQLQYSDSEFHIDYIKQELNDAFYFIPKYGQHRIACRQILSGELYEPRTHEFVSFFCSQFNGSMIHAGTFFGDMLPNFSKFVQGNVYAFEPALENFVMAKMCVEANNLQNVLLQNAALGDTVGNCKVQVIEAKNIHAGGSSKVAEEGTLAPILKIDAIDDTIVLIQLDVEGYELHALKGAEETICRCRPVIAIEDNENICNLFLEQHDYEQAGTLPGLKVWSPKENLEYRDHLREFFK